jgi:hypothetical protein
MPAPPEPTLPPPAPVSVITSSDSPQAIKTSLSKRAALRDQVAGSSNLSILLLVLVACLVHQPILVLVNNKHGKSICRKSLRKVVERQNDLSRYC